MKAKVPKVQQALNFGSTTIPSYISPSKHPDMGQKSMQLSHAEVWDDSALLQSWDDALTEYKVFPSLNHALHLVKFPHSSIIVYMPAVSVLKT